MEIINDIASYFNQNQKAAQRLSELQIRGSVSNDRVSKMKHEIQTRWQSLLNTIYIYIF